MPEGVRKRGDGYQAYIEIRGKHHARTFDTQGEAVAWRTHMKYDNLVGDFTDPSRGRTTVSEWADVWLDMNAPSWSEGSYTRFESVVRNHIKPEFGHLWLIDLDMLRVQRWVNTMDPPLQHSTFPVLRMLMKYAVYAARIKRSPCEGVRLATHKSRPMTFLEPDELWEFLSHTDDEWLQDVILGLAFTGARISEFAAIKPEHVDLDRGEIEVYATKTKSTRVVGITLPLHPVIQRRLAAGHEYVWSSVEGAQINPANFRARRWYPLREAAGWPDLRVHDLRHTCASWLIKAGHNPVQVCNWMGHSKPTQTLDTYAHLFKTDVGDMAESIARMWDAA